MNKSKIQFSQILCEHSIQYFKSAMFNFLEVDSLSGFELKMANFIEILLTKCNSGTIQK